jgi:hypothetical protein
MLLVHVSTQTAVGSTAVQGHAARVRGYDGV